MTTAKQFDRQQTEIIENRDPKSGSQLLLESIAAQGVDMIFGYPGGAIMPVYDALPKYPQLRHILCRHEQGCGMAAIGYARATGKVGQVPTNLMGTDAFQEVDIIGITMPVVKHSYIVRDPADLPGMIAEAYFIAAEGRPGPGLKAANFAVQECDLLIVAGARFDDRATGKLDTFAPHAKVIHMDIDIAEINKLRRVNVGLDGSLKKNLFEWDYKSAQENSAPGVYAPKLLYDLSRRADDSAIFTCDVGQHQMWVAQHCYFDDPKDHITSGGLGTMGFVWPACGIRGQTWRP